MGYSNLSIVYLGGKGFSEKALMELDRFRKIRNSIKYYGGDCDESEAESAVKLADLVVNKIRIALKKE